MSQRPMPPTEDDLLAVMIGEDPDPEPEPTGPPRENSAICHPRRVAFADGWCEPCFAKRRAMEPQAIDGKVENELQALRQGTKALEKIWRDAKQVLENNLKTYAELHMEAARKAAAKGDARPMEWALSRVRGSKGKPVVEEPEQLGDKGGGVKVLINIPLGGLPAPAPDAPPAIDITPVPDEG